MRAFGLAVAIVVGFGAGAQQAQAAWPEKPITVTVGFGAGGTTDVGRPRRRRGAEPAYSASRS